MITSRTRARLKRNLIYYTFLMGPLLVYMVFFIVPNASALFLSLFKWDGISPTRDYVGLGNYSRLFLRTPMFWKALRNTVLYSLILVVGSNLFGFTFALFIHEQSSVHSLFRVIFYLPAIIATSASAYMWTLGIYNPVFGAINAILRNLGMARLATAWLGNPATALLSVVTVHIWHNVGFSMVIYIAGLQDVPEELYESAAIEGAGKAQTLWYITIPLIKPVATVVFIMVTIFGMRAFDYVFIMSETAAALGTTELLATLMFRQGFHYMRMGSANAIAVVLLIAVVSMSGIQRWVLRERD